MWFFCNNKGTYSSTTFQAHCIQHNSTKYNTSTNQCDYTCTNKRTVSNSAGQVLWLQYNCTKYNTKTVQWDYTVTINVIF
jgi:hypothetical protein